MVSFKIKKIKQIKSMNKSLKIDFNSKIQYLFNILMYFKFKIFIIIEFFKIFFYKLYIFFVLIFNSK